MRPLSLLLAVVLLSTLVIAAKVPEVMQESTADERQTLQLPIKEIFENLSNHSGLAHAPKPGEHDGIRRVLMLGKDGFNFAWKVVLHVSILQLFGYL